jgi:hypothetical protein|tara:strand:+ start:432 stop:884 length:453 start_codon:yes stop_codon:yes gene_type:complete
MIRKRATKRKSINDELCAITILGEPASKANSRRIVRIGERVRSIKSHKALTYAKGFEIQCPTRKEIFEEDVAIAMKIFYRNRRPDLDESLILDLLENKVYKNDRLVKYKSIEHGLDKEEPRTIIVISKLSNKELVVNKLKEILDKEEQCK